MSYRLPLLALLFSACTFSHAAESAPAFCLYKITNDGKSERFVNLTVVQYVELNDTDVKLFFGGGNFGAGHEVKLPVKNRDEGRQLLRDLQKAGKECKLDAS